MECHYYMLSNEPYSPEELYLRVKEGEGNNPGADSDQCQVRVPRVQQVFVERRETTPVYSQPDLVRDEAEVKVVAGAQEEGVGGHTPPV